MIDEVKVETQEPAKVFVTVDDNKSVPKKETSWSILIICFVVLISVSGIYAIIYTENLKQTEMKVNESYHEGLFQGQNQTMLLVYSQMIYASENCRTLNLPNNVSFVSTNCLSATQK